MNMNLRKAIAPLIVAVGAAAALVPGAADAYVLMGTSPGSRLTMSLAMQALIGNQPVSNAMAQWNQVGIGTGQDHAFFVGQTGGTAGTCGRNQVNEVTWSGTNCGLAFGSSTLAVTTSWSSSGKVIEVDMLFNNTKSWSSYDGPLKFNPNGTSINDLTRVALHELGHAAGLDHPDDAGQSVASVMNSHISDTYTLQPDDIAGAHAIAWQGASSGSTPVCSLSATPSSINAGGSSTLVASCSPAATSYSWTNTGFSSSTSGGVVSPSVTTTFRVIGSNSAGAGNSASATVTVIAALPDLQITNLTGPVSGTVGGQINLNASVRNNGSGTAPPFRVGFYLSSDSVINAADLLISTCNFASGLAAGQSNSCSGVAAIPSGITAGTYHLGAIVDDILAISESNETNNASAASSGSIVLSSAVQTPVCTLTASPAAITSGGSSVLSASCSPVATSYSWINTGFGAGTSGGMVAPAATTSYSVTGINAAGAGNTASVTVSVSGATSGAPNIADLWWAGSAENGWGISIHQHGNSLFSAIYVYDNAGRPAWYVMPTGTWNSGFTTYSGLVYQPTSAPLNAYTPAAFVPGAAVGSASITFSSTSTALLQYTINGVSGQKSIQRQLFGYGAAPINVGDMWWGGSSQDGWGISITQQAGILFGAWYSYGPDGRVTWYVLPSGTWNGTTYSGAFYSTTSSAWLGASYNPNQLTVTQAGNMSLSFTGSGTAIMTYSFTSGPFAGTTQSKQIVRQVF